MSWPMVSLPSSRIPRVPPTASQVNRNMGYANNLRCTLDAVDGANLFWARNEENGLRCVYHGWKFDVTGRCVDMPSEPPESGFKNKVSITAYPCVERGGVIWAYMGPANKKPAFPDIEWTNLPESHRFATRHIQECNWFQALE